MKRRRLRKRLNFYTHDSLQGEDAKVQRIMNKD